MENKISGDYCSRLIYDYNPLLDIDFWIPIISIIISFTFFFIILINEQGI